MPVQAGLPDGRTGAVGRRHTRTVPLSSPPLAITGLPSRSIPTAIALATPITDFQRQHRRNVETGCRGGTEGGEVAAEECCIAPRCRVEPFLDQGGAAARRRVRRSPRRALALRRPRPARPRRPVLGGVANLPGSLAMQYCDSPFTVSMIRAAGAASRCHSGSRTKGGRNGRMGNLV